MNDCGALVCHPSTWPPRASHHPLNASLLHWTRGCCISTGKRDEHPCCQQTLFSAQLKHAPDMHPRTSLHCRALTHCFTRHECNQTRCEMGELENDQLTPCTHRIALPNESVLSIALLVVNVMRLDTRMREKIMTSVRTCVHSTHKACMRHEHGVFGRIRAVEQHAFGVGQHRMCTDAPTAPLMAVHALHQTHMNIGVPICRTADHHRR